MTDLTALVPKLSVFLSQLQDPVVAIKDNAQLFVASQNIIKTAPLMAGRNTYKLVETGGPLFAITDLVLNQAESLLAVVGEKNITVVDLKQGPDFASSSAVWNAFSLSLGPFDQVKSVKWHPASTRNFELVVLTSSKILLFDVVLSLSEPLCTVDVSTLTGATSIAFGSNENLAGAITLYISTSNGSIYAVYPFLSKDSKIKASKLLVLQYVTECRAMVEAVESEFPPVSILSDPRASALLSHHRFAQDLQKQLSSPLNAEAEPSDILQFTHQAHLFGLQIQGPIAKCAPGSRLLQVSSNETASVLCSLGEISNTATITFLAQLQPLIMGWKEYPSTLGAPAKIQPKAPIPKVESYAKPARGFGFVDVSDSEDEEEVVKVLDPEVKKYDEELAAYKLEKDVIQFFKENFNSLTPVSVDDTGLAYSSTSPFKSADDHKFIYSSQGSILVCDCEVLVSKLLAGSTEFEASYLLISSSELTTGVAFFEDTTQDSGSYVIAASTSGAEVFRVESKVQKTIESVAPATVKSWPAQEAETYKDGGFAFDMKSLSQSLPQIHALNPESATSLKELLSISTAISKQVGALTKFMVSLRTRMKMQTEELRAQTEELSSSGPNSETEQKLQSNMVMIEQLSTRQERLTRRQKGLLDRVTTAFEKSRLNTKLPLSEAEQKWFKEINHINAQVTVNSKDGNSLTKDVQVLQERVKKITTEGSEKDDSLDSAFNRMLLGSDLARLNHFLAQEGKVIALAKAKLQKGLAAMELLA